MSYKDKDKEYIMYSYVRDGKTYHTPNEQIAAQRSDSGEYYIEIHNKQPDKDLKSEE